MQLELAIISCRQSVLIGLRTHFVWHLACTCTVTVTVTASCVCVHARVVIDYLQCIFDGPCWPIDWSERLINVHREPLKTCNFVCDYLWCFLGDFYAFCINGSRNEYYKVWVKKVAPLKHFPLFSLSLSIFAWNFENSLPVYQFTNLFTNFCRFILIFNKIALIFLRVLNVFTVSSLEFQQVGLPWLHR